MLIVRLNRLLRKSVEQLSANLLRQNKLHLRAMRNEIWNINHRFYVTSSDFHQISPCHTWAWLQPEHKRWLPCQTAPRWGASHTLGQKIYHKVLCTRCVIWQLFSRLVSCGWEHHTPWGREFTTRYILCTSTLTTICKAFDVEHHTPCWGREWDIKS